MIIPFIIVSATVLSSFFQSKAGSKIIQETSLPLNFRLPYQNPSGLTSAGRNLWISGWSTGMIYKHKADVNLTLQKYFPMSDISAVSVTSGENTLWTIGQDNNIRKHRKGLIFRHPLGTL